MMNDPLSSQSTPDLYDDSQNEWGDVQTSKSMVEQQSTSSTTPPSVKSTTTTTSSAMSTTEKPLPSLSQQSSSKGRKSSIISNASTAKIYGMPENPLPQPSVINANASSSNNNSSGSKLPQDFLKIRVTGIMKNRRDYFIEFDVSTNLKQLECPSFKNVQRTYEELIKLSEQLALANPQTIVPALPPNQTNAQTEEEDDRRVKVAFQKWFDRISDDDDLKRDLDLQAFIMNKFSYVPVQVFKRKASTFNWLGRPTPDDDLELVTAKDIHNSQETAFLSCVQALEVVIRRNRDLANCESEVGEKMMNLSIIESERSLSNALQVMGRVEHAISDVQLTKCANDLITVYDGFSYHASNARAVKDTLQQRTQLLEEYQLAVKATISKRRNLEKMKGSSSIKTDKVDEMLNDLQISKGYENHLAGKVENMSKNLHMSLERHAISVEKDIHHTLMENARMNVICTKQSIVELEAVLNVIETIGNVESQSTSRTISQQEHQKHELEIGNKSQSNKLNEGNDDESNKQVENENENESESERKENANEVNQEVNQVNQDPLGASIVKQPLSSPKMISQSTIISNPSKENDEKINNNINKNKTSMTQSMTALPSITNENKEKRLLNERKRLNAREAASKLANAF